MQGNGQGSRNISEPSYRFFLPEQEIRSTEEMISVLNNELKELENNNQDLYVDNSKKVDECKKNIEKLLVKLRSLKDFSCKADNYNSNLDNLDRIVRISKDHIKKNKKNASEEYKSLLSNWLDIKGYNYSMKFHQDIKNSIDPLIKILKDTSVVNSNKTKQEQYEEALIINTLSVAYDNIERLVFDYRCCSFKTDVEPTLSVDLKEFNSAYIRFNNSIYYINKKKNICEKLSLTDFDFNYYDKVIPHNKYPCELSVERLKIIKSTTLHTIADQDDIDLQIKTKKDLLAVKDLCANLNQSGNIYFRYIGGLFTILAVLIFVMAALMVGMYLGGGTATAIITSSLVALHATQLLASLVTISGISLPIVAPVFLSVSGVVLSASSGLIGYGFWSAGADKNPITQAARKCSDSLLSIMPPVADKQDTSFTPD